MLVSNGSGRRPSAAQAGPRSPSVSWTSVRMNPSSSVAIPVSQSVAGSAPMKQNNPEHGWALRGAGPPVGDADLLEEVAAVEPGDLAAAAHGHLRVGEEPVDEVGRHPAAMSGPRTTSETSLPRPAR